MIKFLLSQLVRPFVKKEGTFEIGKMYSLVQGAGRWRRTKMPLLVCTAVSVQYAYFYRPSYDDYVGAHRSDHFAMTVNGKRPGFLARVVPHN